LFQAEKFDYIWQMKEPLKLGVYFLSILLLLGSLMPYNTEDIQPSPEKGNTGASCYFGISSNNTATVVENRTVHFDLSTKVNPGFSKQLSASLGFVAVNSWKFTKDYYFIRFPHLLDKSLEIADIVFPSHYFL
jgi:hypothetical protein